MKADELKSDLCALAAAIKMVQAKAERYQPDYAGASVIFDEMILDLRSVYAILFFPVRRSP